MRVSVAAAPVVVAAALAGCGGSTATSAEPVTRQVAAPRPPAKTCRLGVESRLGSKRVAYAAVAQRPLLAYRSPGGARFTTFPRVNANGVPNVFGVLGVVKGRDCQPQWFRVELPMRPNGSIGWIRAKAVWIGRVRTRIEIDVSRRRLTSSREDGEKAPPSYIREANEAARIAAELIGGQPAGSLNEVLLDVPTTAHILGGACIGATPDRGVVDAYHRVFGVPGLHVVDGSTLSANPGTNPSLAIVAQAERALALWPNRGEPDPRPPLGDPYRPVEPVAPRQPAL